ncbi:ubiquitin thiolesterase [Cladophialophora yegresii CBS 114405]|uniref:Ubiquitin thiolesterase n=1 Tax=Cladophialophora yegresii CBS 114405 TaxID=1182544 RepID=W9WBV0_9EURO|nr:ubiquitin thiolesterase [Cladophialophora yegresii CBS 114405]EXJ65403.1 ubiquitin thiolesterase [Cladophialophora yegresii CBS 114405]
MSKRKSEEPLEGVFAETSPASKRARFEDVPEKAPTANGGTLNTALPSNGTDEAAGVKERQQEDGVESDVEDDRIPAAPLRQSAPTEGYDDLYLDTINRSLLDFDFEKLCSVTLSNINVYACLVCGKYFQGRGPQSQAYQHALELDHHVFINMETKKVYVLPEGYEVKNKSLDDIKYVVDPKYTVEEVKMLDKDPKESTDLANKRYRPGFIGMNNIKANDYLNVVVQTLAHVTPLRDFFLLQQFPLTAAQLPVRFSTLVRKLWNPRAFRSHVSPHELLQEIALRSSKRFTLTQQSDPVELLTWVLNSLHSMLGGSRKALSSPIHRCFQGKLRMESQAITAKADTTGDRLRFEESSNIKTDIHPYLILTLDLPPVPLFRDAVESKNIIPQVPLTTLLQKYNGLSAMERAAHRVRHRLLHPLPPYLLFHVKRFSKNKFVAERNPTIVTFPSPRGLDMSPYVEPNPSVHPPGEPILYDMVANIILDTTSVATTGGEDTNAADAANMAVGAEGLRVAWKVQLRDKAAAYSQRSDLPEWLEIQDLWVQRAESETLFTREGYLMVWERRRERKKGKQPNGVKST